MHPTIRERSDIGAGCVVHQLASLADRPLFSIATGEAADDETLGQFGGLLGRELFEQPGEVGTDGRRRGSEPGDDLVEPPALVLQGVEDHCRSDPDYEVRSSPHVASNVPVAVSTSPAYRLFCLKNVAVPRTVRPSTSIEST